MPRKAKAINAAPTKEKQRPAYPVDVKLELDDEDDESPEIPSSSSDVDSRLRPTPPELNPATESSKVNGDVSAVKTLSGEATSSLTVAFVSDSPKDLSGSRCIEVLRKRETSDRGYTRTRVVCHYCAIRFSCKAKLIKHFRHRHLDEELIHFCLTCDKFFQRELYEKHKEQCAGRGFIR